MEGEAEEAEESGEDGSSRDPRPGPHKGHTESPGDCALLWRASKSTLRAFSILPLSFPFA